MKFLSRPIILVAIFLFSLSGVTPVQAGTIEITEWLVPWENTRPRDPYVDNKGRVWFCGQGGGYLAILYPISGNFKKFELSQGAGPHNLIVDNDGFVWFAGNLSSYIGKLNPDSGEIIKYHMPNKEVHDPHTLVFDNAGHIWFTLQHGNFIDKLTMKTGKIQLVKISTPNARPYGIRVDSKGRPWIVLFGSYKLATVNPQTMLLEEYELPNKNSRPRRLAITSDDKIWYVDYAEGFLGSFEPNTKKFEQWPLPGGKDSYPYAMAVDDSDNLWMVETGLSPNRLVGFATETKNFFGLKAIPSGGESVRHMFFHKPSRELWFGEDSNYIARARIK